MLLSLSEIVHNVIRKIDTITLRGSAVCVRKRTTCFSLSLCVYQSVTFSFCLPDCRINVFTINLLRFLQNAHFHRVTGS